MPIIDITPLNNNVNFEKFKRYFTITTETKDCFDYISKHSKLLEETYIKKLDFKDKKELLNKKFEESHK